MNIINSFLVLFINLNIFTTVILEFIAVLFGILSVIFSQKSNILVYPIGIISTGIYIYLNFTANLYGNMIINSYYIIISFYGWYLWKQKRNNKKILYITYSNKKDYITISILFTVIIFISILTYIINNKFVGKYIYIYMDIFTTGIFFVSMYQMTKKKIESWIFWAIGNSISIILYFYNGMILTSIQFIIFTFLSVKGYFIWEKEFKKNVSKRID